MLILSVCADSVVASLVLWVVETDSVVDCASVVFAGVACVCASDVGTCEVSVVATVVGDG